jgi:hypothetical protein
MKPARSAVLFCWWIGSAVGVWAQAGTSAQEAAPPSNPATQNVQVLTPEERRALTMKELHAITMMLRYQRGEITLSPDDVREYTAILEARQERRATELAAAARSGNGHPRIDLHHVPLAAIATPYGIYAQLPVTVTDRAKKTLISLKAAAATNDAIVPLIEGGLRSQGIVIVRTSAGITLDIPTP